MSSVGICFTYPQICMRPRMRPPLMGRGGSFSHHAQEVERWSQAANLEPANMDLTAREVCAVAGSGRKIDPGGAMRITQLSNHYFVSDKADSVYQVLPPSLHFERATQRTDEYSVCSDLSRRKAESRVQMGGASPETFRSALCMQDASDPRSGKSLALVSANGHSGISAVASPVSTAWRRRSTRCFGGDGCGCGFE